jgi:hypothetical protein
LSAAPADSLPYPITPPCTLVQAKFAVFKIKKKAQVADPSATWALSIMSAYLHEIFSFFFLISYSPSFSLTLLL